MKTKVMTIALTLLVMVWTFAPGAFAKGNAAGMEKAMEHAPEQAQISLLKAQERSQNQGASADHRHTPDLDDEETISHPDPVNGLERGAEKSGHAVGKDRAAEVHSRNDARRAE